MPCRNLLSGTVLIVEDEPILAYSVKEVLMQLGAKNATVIDSNKDAIKALNNNQFTFVLLDVGLADGNSRKVADQLLSNQTAFLTVSGYPDPASANVPESAHFLSKPFSRSELISSIERAVNCDPHQLVI